jgi:hypothetical protein
MHRRYLLRSLSTHAIKRKDQQTKAKPKLRDQDVMIRRIRILTGLACLRKKV